MCAMKIKVEIDKTQLKQHNDLVHFEGCIIYYEIAFFTSNIANIKRDRDTSLRIQASVQILN